MHGWQRHTTRILNRSWRLRNRNHICTRPPFGLCGACCNRSKDKRLWPRILASCSIPFWLDAVHDIPGAPRGAYWDGGITDYHLHLPYPVAADPERKIYHLYGLDTAYFFLQRTASLVIDTSDIRKDYGQKFQYLDKVRDGDKKKEIVSGYTFLSVTAVFGQGRQLPLYTAPYSTKAPEWDSENAEFLKAVETVRGAVGTKGVWVADKHFDNRWIFNEFEARHLRFLIAGWHAERTHWSA